MEGDYKVQLEEERGFIHVHGDFDDEEAGEAFRKAFNRVFDSGRRTVILDLEKVDIINSYGIGKILISHRRLQAEGGTLMFMPLRGNVKDILELLMIDTVIPTFKEEEVDAQEEAVSGE